MLAQMILQEDPMRWTGTLLNIHIAPAASYEMEELAEAQLEAGRGIVGDRYYLGTGTYSARPDVREVTLIEAEVLEAIAIGEPQIPGFKGELLPEDHRRNLTTRGVPLNHLVGKRFRVGECVLYAARMNFPCKYIEELLQMPGLYEGLLNRSGLNCAIEVGGVIRPGDAILPMEG
ncbi:MOSC domain-containing protein [Pararhodobacter sp. CCB-MM2]|uniref:MOSC domain-containing protein n=1 Tax=Pararhodobacter sp. CCB-MM2 TaxID=1786003 RepID=UPI000A7F1CD9|nr:MOSC domain-containing protein [Pararhodobacter sp. CCB-MM2]